MSQEGQLVDKKSLRAIAGRNPDWGPLAKDRVNFATNLAQNPPYFPHLSPSGSANNPKKPRTPLTYLRLLFGSNCCLKPKNEWGKIGAKRGRVYEYTAYLDLLNQKDAA